jgi:hypothetical protein
MSTATLSRTPVQPSPEAIKAAFAAAVAVAEAIRELHEVPSGHLYARLMQVMDYTRYSRIIDLLERERLVHRAPSGLLTWIG